MRRANSVMAQCHPDRLHKAHGLCDTCYAAEKRETKEGSAAARLGVWANRWAVKLKTTKSMFLEWYDKLFQEQGGVCAICVKPCRSRHVLSVDHDHQTGKLRGLLCSECNLGLGKYGDNPCLLRRAAAYLEKHKTEEETNSEKRPVT